MLWLSSSIPHKLHLLQVHCCWQVLYFVCSDVGWCQLAWDTMETRFVYFLIVKWTHCIQLAFTILPANQWYQFTFWVRLMALKKMVFKCYNLNNTPIRPSKTCWSEVERENYVHPGLIAVERHNLIGYFFSLADTERTGLNNPILSVL